MNLEKRTVRNKVWWIAGAILLPLLLFLALGAQDQVVSYSAFKVPAVSAYYFIYYAEKWFGVFHLFLTAEYYGSNVPLFRRNGYRQSGVMIP